MIIKNDEINSMSKNNPIRVLMATEYPFDESVIRGGIESVAFHMAQALSSRPNIELHIVSFSNKVNMSRIEKRKAYYIHWLKHRHNLKGIQTLRLFTTDIIRLRRLYNLINPDIIHIQNLSGYALACRKRDRVVISIHGVEAVTDWAKSNSFYKGIIGFLRLKAERFTFRQALKRTDCIISNSGSYAVNILKGYIKDTLIEYIDHPISHDFFSKWSKIPSDKLMVLGVAGISERKRTIDLIKAIKIVTNKLPVKLTLLGPIVEKEYYRSVISIIKDLKMEQIVILDTVLNQQKLIDAYKKCSVFVLPSSQETAPMAIAAAMAIGRPIIATRVGGVSNMVEHGKSGYLYNYGDINMLSKRLIQLLSDAELLNKFGKQSRTIAVARFASNIVAEKTIKTYYNLLLNKEERYE